MCSKKTYTTSLKKEKWLYLLISYSNQMILAVSVGRIVTVLVRYQGEMSMFVPQFAVFSQHNHFREWISRIGVCVPLCLYVHKTRYIYGFKSILRLSICVIPIFCLQFMLYMGLCGFLLFFDLFRF